MTAGMLQFDLNVPGVIGTRSIRCLQLVRIGRHTSTVMPVPAQGLWVVAGRGPQTGSNGAGKTVALGAMSLLLGDAQWNGGGGTGPSATRLLFDHDRARVTDSAFRNAQLGYIAGVFFNTGARDPVSVWMRIERYSSPYVQVRWMEGIHLATGDAEPQRVASADAVWASMQSGGSAKVTDYAKVLYGDAPRCIASIRARGSEENQDRGLLALGQRSFKPADLASQVIMLSGKQHVLDAERQLRQQLDANESALVGKKADYEEQCRRENLELADIARRKRARDLSGQAEQQWTTYLTIAYLIAHHAARDSVARVADLEEQVRRQGASIAEKKAEIAGLPSRQTLAQSVSHAKTRLEAAGKRSTRLSENKGGNSQRQKALEERIAELAPRAALALGVTIPGAEDSLARAGLDLEGADRAYAWAERDHEEAEAYLQKVMAGSGGPAGEALEALKAEGVDALSILDLITLPETDRQAWEARLSPYARTIVMSRDGDASARGREILAAPAHAGVLVIWCDGPVRDVAKAAPGQPGLLGELLRRLGDRMPDTKSNWIEDWELSLSIHGGYDPPLTDRQSMIGAAQAVVDSLTLKLHACRQQQKSAKGSVDRAQKLLSATKDAVELDTNRTELLAAQAESRRLADEIEDVKTAVEEARVAHASAVEEYESADKRLAQLNAELESLKDCAAPGRPPGLDQLRDQVAEAREDGRKQQERAGELRLITGIGDLSAAEATLAASETSLDSDTMARYFHEARRQLRLAVEAVHVTHMADESAPVQAPTRTIGDEAHHLQLNAGLQNLYDWCERQASAQDSIGLFADTERPLRVWLEWNGDDDAAREADIAASREQGKAEIAAAEHDAEETRRWLQGRQDIQIDIINKMFADTERTLRELLGVVSKDPVRLRPEPTDIEDVAQPLRWELRPQWQPRDRKPVDYDKAPNTAELIILHLLLATSSLAAATTTRGRVLILDESGNNLDGPNLRRVSHALKQVAEKYGLTVVLACQDLYTDIVTEYSAGVIQLVRVSDEEPLNAPPAILWQEDDPAIIEALGPYLQMGRPDLAGA
jgi:hypothetical protein